MSAPSLRLPPTRYLVLGGLATLITIFLLASHAPASLRSLSSHLGADTSGLPAVWHKGEAKPAGWEPPKEQDWQDWEEESKGNATTGKRANAAFVVLARNSDLWELLASIRGMEDRFNSKYNYPWVFLNEEPFTEQFKLHTSGLASGPCTYGLIPRSEWDDIPAWIDKDKMNHGIAEMSKLPIPYGFSLPYRKMCRYQSGFFWRHPLLDKYKYYWRVEPNVKFFCDLDYDPFLLMEEKGKKYGFVVSIYEYIETIPTLWAETKKFIAANPRFVAKDNLMPWVSNDGGETYNLCHYWSNLEIASLEFWRGDAYRAYFDFLDQAGGFFYERWGDAPVHSIAAALFLKKDEIHFFQDIGYRHEPFQHCPKGLADKCACDPNDANNFEDHGYSCTPRYKQLSTWT